MVVKRDSKNEKIKGLRKLDYDILQGLYDYRALSTDQIQRRYNLTIGYTYRKLRLLRISGYIESYPIVRYRAGQRSQGKYYQLTSEGLMALKERGGYVDKQVSQLEVGENYIAYLLATNDLMVDLEPYGWALTDSREIKARLNINRSDNIQGSLQNLHTDSREYGIYTFLHSYSDKNLEKMVREIENYSRGELKDNNNIRAAIIDFVIFKKGQEGFKEIINKLMTRNNGSLLPRVRSLKLFPYTFGKYYLRLFENEDEILRYACSIPKNELSFKRRFVFSEVNSKYSGLDCTVLHKGEEKYFVNLVDNDLKKVFDIQQYRKEDYEKDGRKVLIYVFGGVLREIHETLLQNYHHVEFIEAGEEMIRYLSGIEPLCIEN